MVIAFVAFEWSIKLLNLPIEECLPRVGLDC